MKKGFDPAFSMELPNPERGMGHAFLRPAESLTNFDIPVVPILMNVYYALAVTNGFDSVNTAGGAIDNIPAFVGRVNVTLWGDHPSKGKYEESSLSGKDLFQIGASAAAEGNNRSSGLAAGTLRYKVYQFGIDTAMKVGPFSTQVEYFGRWLDYAMGNTAIPGGRGDSQYAHGGYVQSGILLGDTNLELVGRVSAVWCDGPQNGNAVEIGPGINWYSNGTHNVKLQTDVAWFDVSDDLQDSTEDLDGSFGSAVGSTASSFSSSAASLAAGEQGILWRTQFQLNF
jgi:hypothetical protein